MRSRYLCRARSKQPGYRDPEIAAATGDDEDRRHVEQTASWIEDIRRVATEGRFHGNDPVMLDVADKLSVDLIPYLLFSVVRRPHRFAVGIFLPSPNGAEEPQAILPIP